MKSRHFAYAGILIFAFTSVSWAQKIPVDATKKITIYYASAKWNKDSRVIDSAHLFMRDKASGKVAKIQLQETAPDSAEFEGAFAVRWTGVKEIDPQIYVPPAEIKGDADSVSEFAQLITQGKIVRKPIIFRIDDGRQQLAVYDTKDQAKRAHQAYIRAKEAEEAAKKQLSKPVPSETELEVAKMAERQSMLIKLAAEAAQREADRIRQEQLARQRAEELKRQQEALARQEKQRRIRKAKAFADQALKLYQDGEYVKAEELFRQSTELDPSNKSYYFKYGATLYRNKKYSEALVTLRIAEDEPATALEKKYFIGLSHYRLSEVDQALEAFREVKSAKHEILSPSAAFYEGVILYSTEKYEEAKAPFELVIDTSKDPALDQKAEDYLEKIARVINFEKNKAKTFLLNATLGAMYDSNILYAPDNVSSQGQATEKAGFRVMTSGSAQYRPIYEKFNEFSIDYSTLYIYSLKKDFNRADPFLNTVSLPYTWKGTVGEKGFKLSMAPGFEMLHMAAESDEPNERKNILNTIKLATEATIVMRKDWFATYGFDVQQDDSLLSTSTGDEDSDAMKYTLDTKQNFFLDKAKKTAFIGSGGVTYNAAEGANKKYIRVDMGVTYARPITNWDATWNASLTSYLLQFPDSSGSRQDTNVGLSVGLSKPIREWLNWGMTASYSNNQSTDDNYQYSKYMVLTTASFNWDH